MYLVDPVRGKARRAVVRDRTTSQARRAGRAAATALRNLANRARGLTTEMRSRWAGGAVSDDVLVQRVRAEMGHVVPHPHTVQVSAANGVVTLAGTIRGDDLDHLLAAVAAVRGVKGVESRLEAVPPGTEASGVEAEKAPLSA